MIAFRESERAVKQAVNIEKPSYYDYGVYEPFKVIHAWKSNYCIGSALKYLCRYQNKKNA